MRPKKSLLSTKLPVPNLKQQSKKMEQKLNHLKSLMQKQKNQRNLTQRFLNTKTSIKQQPKLSSPEVNSFLNEIGLVQYYDNFVKNGIDSLEILQQIKKEQLEEIGVLKGHAIKILKHLKTKNNPISNNFMQQQPNHQPQIVQIKKQEKKQLQIEKDLKTKQTIKQVSKQQQKTVSTYQDCQTQSYISNFKSRMFCQKCYKQYEQNIFQGFCSQECKEGYQLDNSVACNQCKKIKNRWDCYKVDEMYFCGDQCLNQIMNRLQKQGPTEYQQVNEEVFWQEQIQKQEVNKKQLEQIQKLLANFQ